MVNGGGTDYNPRNTEGVHVLLTMDETTYDEDDGNTTDDDHPIAWCKKFDGGRSFYTGMGHTQASYSEAGIRSHIAAGIEIAAGKLASAACGVAPANANPVIGATTASKTSGTAPLEVAFTAAATDADGDTLTYTWDLNGDGTFETTGQNPTFSYTTAGTYTPVVKVTDSKGGSTTKTLAAITVTAAPSNSTDVPVEIIGNVPTMLWLTLGNIVQPRDVHAGRGQGLHGLAERHGHVHRIRGGADRPRPQHHRSGPSGQRLAGAGLAGAAASPAAARSPR